MTWLPGQVGQTRVVVGGSKGQVFQTDGKDFRFKAGNLGTWEANGDVTKRIIISPVALDVHMEHLLVCWPDVLLREELLLVLLFSFPSPLFVSCERRGGTAHRLWSAPSSGVMNQGWLEHIQRFRSWCADLGLLPLCEREQAWGAGNLRGPREYSASSLLF